MRTFSQPWARQRFLKHNTKNTNYKGNNGFHWNLRHLFIKRQPQKEWKGKPQSERSYLPAHILDKGLISRIYKYFLQNVKKNNPIKKSLKDFIRYLTEKMSKYSISYEKVLSNPNHQEMQIKTKMRYHQMLTRMAKIKKKKKNQTDSTKHWWKCGATGTLLCHWWECKLVQPLWTIFGSIS